MKLKRWQITKSPNSKTDDPEIGLSVSVVGFEDEEDADSMLDTFKRAIIKAGGQTTFETEEEKSD